MDKETIKYTYRLSSETAQYIKTFAEERKISQSKALEKIIEQNKKEKTNVINQIADAVIKSFEEKYGNILTRIRLGTNVADRNSQILIEILNTLLLENSIDDYHSTDKIKSVVLSDAEQNVKDRIKANATRAKELSANKK